MTGYFTELFQYDFMRRAFLAIPDHYTAFRYLGHYDRP